MTDSSFESSSHESAFRGSCRTSLSAYWYVACASADLGHKPLARQVLAIPLVLFRDRKGQPVALVDRCPHRNVALSQGFWQDGELVCRYHGWRFEGQGHCRLIPGRCEPVASRRYDAIAHPTLEQDGLVWVYGLATSSGGEMPERCPYRVPKLTEPGVGKFSWQIQAPVSLVNGAENFLDGLHTHFVHRGLIRRPKQRQKIRVQITRTEEQVTALYQDEVAISGLIYRLLGGGQGTLSSLGRFILPGIAQLEYRQNEQTWLILTLFLTPIQGRDQAAVRAYGVATFQWGWPTWLGVAIASPLFWLAIQQDRQILQQQAANIQRFGGEAFVSTELDVMRSHIMALLAAADKGETVSPLTRSVEMWV